MDNEPMTPDQREVYIRTVKAEIDTMSHYEMCKIWRFAKAGNKYTIGEIGEYFSKRLYDYWGGFTPEISKELGW